MHSEIEITITHNLFLYLFQAVTVFNAHFNLFYFNRQNGSKNSKD